MTSPRINGRAVIFALASMVSVAAAAVSMAEGKLRVAATTTMVADLAESVAGDHAIVTGLMGPGWIRIFIKRLRPTSIHSNPLT